LEEGAVNTGALPYIGLGVVALWFIIAGRLFCGKACPKDALVSEFGSAEH
jgi:polyferredoxin